MSLLAADTCTQALLCALVFSLAHTPVIGTAFPLAACGSKQHGADTYADMHAAAAG